LHPGPQRARNNFEATTYEDPFYCELLPPDSLALDLVLFFGSHHAGDGIQGKYQVID
jgi:hypothetical protein